MEPEGTTRQVGRELSVRLAQAKAGEPGALDQLLGLLSPRLLRFGTRLCGQAGEDALQEALLTLSQRLHEFRGDSDIYSWAYALVRSACGRHTRGLANAPKLALSEDVLAELRQGDAVPGPEHRLLSRERSEVLSCALGALSEDQRAAVVLRDVEELSAQDAAAALGISVSALKSRLHRGRRALADLLRAGGTRGPCPDVISPLSEQMEGELSAPRCAELEAHLASCAECSARCACLKKLLAECRRLPDLP